MAAIPIDIINNIKKYIHALEERGFPISLAYLFGSYAHGNWNEWSDIDLAIISEQFEGNRFLDKEKIREIHRAIDLRISPLPFTPEDFENSILYDEIANHGVLISQTS